MHFLRKLLFPFSIIFWGIVFIRNLFYAQGWFKVFRMNVPVISIGNLSTGGTGKTPMACYVLAFYQRKGKKVAYLSRGYGRETKGYRQVTEHADGARLFGDEPVLIANRFPSVPVAVCEDRVEGAKRLIRESGAELIILDDAFQHRRIGRDLDIVMVDATQMPDRDWVLPAGNLRESTGALSRAGLVILNKIPENVSPEMLARRIRHSRLAFCRSRFSELVFFRPELSPGISIQMLLVRPVIVFSGLGNNQQFFSQLTEMGADVRKTFSFPDHHVYTPEDLKRITLEFRTLVPENPDLLILTTEKDYCRLNSVNLPASLAPYPCAYITMELVWIQGAETVNAELEKILA